MSKPPISPARRKMLEVILGGVISLPISLYVAGIYNYHSFLHTLVFSEIGFWILISFSISLYFWIQRVKESIQLHDIGEK